MKRYFITTALFALLATGAATAQTRKEAREQKKAQAQQQALEKKQQKLEQQQQLKEQQLNEQQQQLHQRNLNEQQQIHQQQLDHQQQILDERQKALEENAESLARIHEENAQRNLELSLDINKDVEAALADTEIRLQDMNIQLSELQDRLKEYDEIVIKRKNGDSKKDGKVVVEIINDEVLINGKPIDDYVDNELSVRIRSPRHFNLSYGTPFRNGPGWNDENESPKAFLGVSSEGSKEGAVITNVAENSAAAKGGLKKGDIITKIAGKAVYDHEQLVAVVTDLKPDQKVVVNYKRDGKEQKTSVTLGKRSGATSFYAPGVPPNPGAPPAPPAPRKTPRAPFNFDFDNDGFNDLFRNRDDRPRLGIKAQDTEDGKGVKVLSVEAESAAAQSGLKENDIVTSFDGKDINSADDLSRAYREARDKISVKVVAKRNGKTQNLEIKIPRKLRTAEL